MTFDPTIPPLRSGATYDPSTGTFTWTLSDSDQGKSEVVFFVTDAIKSVKLKLKIDVKIGLIFDRQIGFS